MKTQSNEHPDTQDQNKLVEIKSRSRLSNLNPLALFKDIFSKSKVVVLEPQQKKLEPIPALVNAEEMSRETNSYDTNQTHISDITLIFAQGKANDNSQYPTQKKSESLPKMVNKAQAKLVSNHIIKQQEGTLKENEAKHNNSNVYRNQLFRKRIYKSIEKPDSGKNAITKELGSKNSNSQYKKDISIEENSNTYPATQDQEQLIKIKTESAVKIKVNPTPKNQVNKNASALVVTRLFNWLCNKTPSQKNHLVKPEAETKHYTSPYDYPLVEPEAETKHYAFPHDYLFMKFKYNYEKRNKKVNFLYKIKEENLNEERDLKFLYDVMKDCKNIQYQDKFSEDKAREDFNYVENLLNNLLNDKPSSKIVNVSNAEVLKNSRPKAIYSVT